MNTRAPLLLASALLFALLPLAGCETPPDPDLAWVELGGGDSPFAGLADGEILQVERGSQGGMHVWTALRSGYIDPGPMDLWQGLREGSLPRIEFSLVALEGQLSPPDERPYVLSRNNGEYELLEQLVTFDHFAEFPDNWQDIDFEQRERDLEEMDLLLKVRLTDSMGTVVEDERTVRLSFPPYPGEGGELG